MEFYNSPGVKMGTTAQTKSSSQSSQATDSQNTTLTSSVGGNQSVGLVNSGTLSDLSYAYDSNNSTTTNNESYALGAGSSTNSSGAPATSAPSSLAGIDWSEVIVYVIGGVVLVLVLRLFGDKNS